MGIKSFLKSILKVFNILVLSFILLVLCLLALYLYLPYLGGPNRGPREVSSIAQIVRGIDNLYTHKKNYEGLNNSTLVKAKQIPEIMTVDNNSNEIINIFGGDVKIEPTSLGEGESTIYNAFQITYPSVPSKECGQIINAVQKYFVQIKVNDKMIKDFNIKPYKNEIDLAIIQKACGTEEADNEIIFYGNKTYEKKAAKETHL